MLPQLQSLRRLIPNALNPSGDRLATAQTQIALINRQLDTADDWEMAMFREAFRTVFPEMRLRRKARQ